MDLKMITVIFRPFFTVGLNEVWASKFVLMQKEPVCSKEFT